MKKKLLGLLICGVIVLTACSQNEETIATKDTQNEVKESDINETASAELNQQVEDLKGQVEVLTKEHDAFPTISNLTKDFVQAQVTGDKERLNQLITDDVVIEEKGTELYVSTDGGPGFLLFSEELKEQFGGWEIRSAGYSKERGSFDVFLSEFHATPDDEESPISFVNLYFKEVDNQWKIAGVEFDI